jgi:competence protein ComEA
MKKNIWISICLAIVFLSGCGKDAQTYFEEASPTSEEADVSETTFGEHAGDQDETCCVYICGAVQNPGVYELMAGSRIYEAINMAGGLLEHASEDSINQAEELVDGQMIKILTKEEAKDQASAQTEQKESDGRVNLNTADADELMSLPGIGEAKAMSILSYREERGSFSSIEDIMNITGIKEGVYSKIKDYITVN